MKNRIISKQYTVKFQFKVANFKEQAGFEFEVSNSKKIKGMTESVIPF